MERASTMENLRSFAESLQPRLARSGPAPQVSHIMAAILMARDSLGPRDACRSVPELSYVSSVSKLAKRVRPLLVDDVSLSEATVDESAIGDEYSAMNDSTAVSFTDEPTTPTGDVARQAARNIMAAVASSGAAAEKIHPAKGGHVDSDDCESDAADEADDHCRHGGRRDGAGRRGRFIDRMPRVARASPLANVYRVLVSVGAAAPWLTEPSRDEADHFAHQRREQSITRTGRWTWTCARRAKEKVCVVETTVRARPRICDGVVNPKKRGRFAAVMR